MLMMNEKRVQEFGFKLERREDLLRDYNYSKRLLENDGEMLGFGMAASFVADIYVSDLFE